MLVIEENSNVDGYSAPAPLSFDEEEITLGIEEEDAHVAAFSFVACILRDAAAEADMDRFEVECDDDIFSVEDIEENCIDDVKEVVEDMKEVVQETPVAAALESTSITAAPQLNPLDALRLKLQSGLRNKVQTGTLQSALPEQTPKPQPVSPLEAASHKLRNGLIDSVRSGTLRAAFETVHAQKQEVVLRNLRMKLAGTFVQSAHMGTLDGALQVASMVNKAEPVVHQHFNMDDLDADLEEICRDADFEVTESDIEFAEDEMDDVQLGEKVLFMSAVPELVDMEQMFANLSQKLPEPAMDAHTARTMFKTRYAFPRATRACPAVPERTLKKKSEPTVFKAEVSPYAFAAFDNLVDILYPSDEKPVMQEKPQQERPAQSVPVPPPPRSPAEKAPRGRRASARPQTAPEPQQPVQPQPMEFKQIEVPAEVLASLEGSSSTPQRAAPPESMAAALAAAAQIWEPPKEPPKTAPSGSTRPPLVQQEQATPRSSRSLRPQPPQELFPASFAAMAPQPPSTAPPRSRPSAVAAPAPPTCPPEESLSPRRRRRQQEPMTFRMDANSDTEGPSGATGRDLESGFKALGAEMFNMAAQDRESSSKPARRILPPPTSAAGSPKRGLPAIGSSLLPDITRKSPTVASIEYSKRMSSCAMAQSARNAYF
eukprot:gnl/MRDRNA2_/MRDRNA2_144691_c0_seq1.p1 gnl/MRDRNA2_/MRDRNA2_144691_c0~~gnl/MRDRNA2_/MRDRNA2_144691_c0_seq1.p1  ORF type:complete len:757 (+),score=192.23 gnl/MRDRNA2_/MRDRNA2_144691_c0_seq1:302-2272(+)